MIKKQKPKSFSDYYNDNTQENLNKILAKDIYSYGYSDFVRILGPILPAGLYEETIYALPLLLEHLKLNQNEQLDLIDVLTGYIGKHSVELKSDEYWEYLNNELQAIILGHLSVFNVKHYNKEDCRKKGWGLEYQDVVQNLEVILEFMEECQKHDSMTPLILSITDNLMNSQSPTKELWILELWRSQFEETPVTRIMKYFDFFKLKDNDFIKGCFNIVEESNESILEGTYWRDLSFTLKSNEVIEW